MDSDGESLPFDSPPSQVFTGEMPDDEPIGLLAYVNCTGFGQSLETGRKVCRIANRRVVHPKVIPDLPHDHQPGVQSDPDSQLHALWQGGLTVTELPLNSNGCHDGSAGMVFMGQRRPEQSHKPVAKKLIDGAFIAMNLGDRHLKELVEHSMHPVRTNLFSKSCGIGEVAEDHRHLLSLPFESAPGSQNFFSKVFRRIVLR